MPRVTRSYPRAWGVFLSGLTGLAVVVTWASAAPVAKPKPVTPAASLEQQFATSVRPVLQAYCVGCHGKTNPQAQLDLAAWTTMAGPTNDFPHAALVQERLELKQMPPAAAKQPSPAQRNAVIAWIKAVRKYDAERNAGDPGPVLARRLSNAEYDYTIRDLTGQDLHPTREFPVDPANQEGFDNSGESLTMSPALMKKYLQTAHDISEHMVLTSHGFQFASHPVLAETDRDKYCILRIVEFYKRQPTDLANYFEAAWRYRNRAALGQPQATLQTIAADAKISPRYLDLVWKTLTAPGEKVGPVAQLQAKWNALPKADAAHPDGAHDGSVALRNWATALRKKVAWKFNNLRVPRGFSPGGQIFVLWKDRAYASHRRMLYPDALQVNGTPKPRTVLGGSAFGQYAGRSRTVVDPVDPELFVPGDEPQHAAYVKSFEQFCSVFPDAFYISERGRMFVDDPGDEGRLLSAGLHNSMGYFRDDTPLMELILDEKGRKELDTLWHDFDFVAQIPERMLIEFYHYERAESSTMKGPEFDFARAESKDATSDAMIHRLNDMYLAKARAALAQGGGDPLCLQAIEDHFKWVSATIRGIEKVRAASEPTHLASLVDFARRAYRRPLTAAERANLLAFYQSLRQDERLSHEDALRDSLVSILMSPNFLYRVDLENAAAAPATRVRTAAAPRTAPPATGSGVQPLSDYALASRLSYFLWSSMPDEELLSHAAAGDLHQPEVLTAQARRMLRDPRAKALAVEFGGNWLDFRRFEEHNAVDRDRFPTFTDDLREAMFQEPVRFLLDQVQNDRSVLDMLYGKYTFVNAPLAKHYGMADVKVSGDQWVRVENADRYGRGGLLPMAVFLTKNAPGLRTSPVKRGYWVVRRLLGERIPPPPPTVPQLPKDESHLGDRTLRQVLEQHRANPACAPCHARFDSFGLVFEGYGPVGEVRTADLGGKPVDTRAVFPGGAEETGLAGLRAFIHQQREDEFLDNLSRKLLSYALGRTLLPSDEATLHQMRTRLAANGYRFSSLVESIVISRQFRYRRAAVAIASS